MTATLTVTGDKDEAAPVEAAGLYRVFVRSLEFKTVIGVHEHEKRRPQTLRISLEALAYDHCAAADDRLERVVCYETLASLVKTCVESWKDKGLVESFGHRLALRLLEDKRIAALRLRLEKPDVLAGGAVAGIELVRLAAGAPPAARAWARSAVL